MDRYMRIGGQYGVPTSGSGHCLLFLDGQAPCVNILNASALEMPSAARDRRGTGCGRAVICHVPGRLCLLLRTGWTERP